MSLQRGAVVLVDLEPTLGHEQQGTRPCVVVSDAAVNSNQRFPLIAVVPVTGTPAKGALYPALAPGTSGLTKPSTALVDQLRSIDKQRIRRRYGQISSAELQAIDAGLCLYLGLEPDG
jgi:mRNA interferase MazF